MGPGHSADLTPFQRPVGHGALVAKDQVVKDNPVVGIGVDPVTSRFSGRFCTFGGKMI